MVDKKDMQIVTGDGENLDISEVQDNVGIATPTEDSNVKRNIIIPEEKK